MIEEQIKRALALCESAADVCFIAETVAHLQGREKYILPATEKLREDIEGMKGALVLKQATCLHFWILNPATKEDYCKDCGVPRWVVKKESRK